MRDQPFETDKPLTPAANQVNGTGTYKDHVIDLTKHLSTEARDNTNNTDQGGEEEPGADQERAPGTEPKAGAGTFTDEGGAKEKLNEFVSELEKADVMTLSKMLVQIFNVGRVFVLPNLYFNMMYSGQERYDVKTVTEKAAANLKQDKPATEGFNDYEKDLHARVPVLRNGMANVSYTNDEIEMEAELLARYIGTIGVPAFLNKYMWILGIIQLEIGHGKFILEHKGSSFLNNKMGIK